MPSPEHVPAIVSGDAGKRDHLGDVIRVDHSGAVLAASPLPFGRLGALQIKGFPAQCAPGDLESLVPLILNVGCSAILRACDMGEDPYE